MYDILELCLVPRTKEESCDNSVIVVGSYRALKPHNKHRDLGKLAFDLFLCYLIALRSNGAPSAVSCCW